MAPYGYPVHKKTNGMSLAGMILGIVSICLFWLSIFDIPVAITGLVLSLIGRAQIKKKPHELTGNGLALTGIITSILAIVLIIIVLIIAVNLVAEHQAFCRAHPFDTKCT